MLPWKLPPLPGNLSWKRWKLPWKPSRVLTKNADGAGGSNGAAAELGGVLGELVEKTLNDRDSWVSSIQLYHNVFCWCSRVLAVYR